MTKPQFSPSISLGNVLTILIALVGGTLAFAEVQSQASQNASVIASLKVDTERHEARLRMAETEIARSDERLASILTLLSRIDNRLERIERDRAGR